MKIVVIIPTLSMGGAERVAVAFSNWMSKYKKDEIYLINMGKESYNFEFDNNLKVYHQSDYPEEIQEKSVIRRKLFRIKYMLNILDKIKPDIIFEMLYYPIFLIKLYKIRNKNVLIIGSERNNPKEKSLPMKKKMLAKIVPIFCDGYIFQTQKVKNMFSKKIQSKSIVIPNAVSNPYISEIDKKDKKNKVISNMGRLHYQKGQDILIKAFYIVNKKYPEYKLKIYGEGNERKQLEKLIENLDLKNKVILEGKNPKAILEVIKSEIFVFTSRYEGMPNALLEAMACGLPCISTDCIAGPSEIIENNKNGILVEVDNVQQIAEQIIYLIENKNIAQKLGQEAKKVLKDYSVDNIFGRYYDFFECLYKKRKENKVC